MENEDKKGWIGLTFPALMVGIVLVFVLTSGKK
jgi:hypothetical protein